MATNALAPNELRQALLTGICTITAPGPYSKTVYFVASASASLIAFLTGSDSRWIMATQSTQRPRVGMTVADSNQPWGEPHRGAQITGSLHHLAPETAVAQCLFADYLQKFPACRTTYPDLNSARSAGLELYAIAPEQITLISESIPNSPWVYYPNEFGL